jgi:hypothetical protein
MGVVSVAVAVVAGEGGGFGRRGWCSGGCGCGSIGV